MNNDVSVSIASGIALNVRKYAYLGIKRGFDILFSLVGCLFLIPIYVVIKVANMISGDFSKVFYSQDRIGKNGKTFRLYKFRSMVPNADEELVKILKNDKKLADEYKLNKKLKDDPRITKIGKFIRKTSIDELPQLINVFLGEMSLVGNRPYLPREKEDMGDYFEDIIKTKPGVTGYWQVSGRSETTFDERCRLERYYSNNAGLKMDIRIFFKTFKAVICHKGAE